MFYFARCMNIIFNSLLAQLVKYDVHKTRKIKSHAICYHILLFYVQNVHHWLIADSFAALLMVFSSNADSNAKSAAVHL